MECARKLKVPLMMRFSYQQPVRFRLRLADMSLIIPDKPSLGDRPPLKSPAQQFPHVLLVTTLALALGACGGSGGSSSDAEDIAEDDFSDPLTASSALQDDESCNAEIDIAEFFLTESDRQWSCEVSSIVGIRFDELYFNRNGTASFASTGVWYWNRNLPEDEINLASPAEPITRMTDIGSSNSVLVFRTINDASFEEIYDCVLTPRALISNL